MKLHRPDAWVIGVLVCCLVFSWLLSFSSTISAMESAYYQKLVELAPALTTVKKGVLLTTPYGLQNLVLLSVFGALASYLVWTGKKEPSVIFVIQVIFTLLMLQILLAVMQQFWLPTIWTIISFSLTALLLVVRCKLINLRKLKPLSVEQKLQAIKQKIEEQNYETAVVMLKNCQFSEEMFDIAYELGQKLEQQENWILARYLYNWLVQFDPGIQDFVTRMDRKINPELEENLSTTEITGNKGQFSHYQLVGKKAVGATATVYEAYDFLTHKRIALKILNQESEDTLDDRDVLSFLREANTVSKLDHPNIVKIHDADIIEERAYIAMDYIAGYPMSERLRRKKYLTVAESLRIMQSVLNALIFAHNKHIVHGDIKPANIMYDKNRKLFILTDFGAANSKHYNQDTEKTIVGTPAYMSPEQLSGSKIDGRSDIYSLGVTMYHLMSGIQPFTGEKLSDLKKSIMNDKADMDLLKVPDMLKQVLDKALQKKTYQRFADASQMLQAVVYCEGKLKEFSEQ